MDQEQVDDRVKRVRDKLLANKGTKPLGKPKSKKQLRREQQREAFAQSGSQVLRRTRLHSHAETE